MMRTIEIVKTSYLGIQITFDPTRIDSFNKSIQECNPDQLTPFTLDRETQVIHFRRLIEKADVFQEENIYKAKITARRFGSKPLHPIIQHKIYSTLIISKQDFGAITTIKQSRPAKRADKSSHT
jgi:hypothetical protein